METVQNTLVARESSGWRKSDTVWMLGLYGTAIGAGVLFLPINAGVGGLIPLIIMAILAFPMTFCPPRFNPFCPVGQKSGRRYYRSGGRTFRHRCR